MTLSELTLPSRVSGRGDCQVYPRVGPGPRPPLESGHSPLGTGTLVSLTGGTRVGRRSDVGESRSKSPPHRPSSALGLRLRTETSVEGLTEGRDQYTWN